jgi:hypothetical protein
VRARYWLPLLAAAACLIVATRVSPIPAFVLTIAALALVFEVSTKMFEKAGGTGGISDHRQ